MLAGEQKEQGAKKEKRRKDRIEDVALRWAKSPIANR